VRKVQNRQQKIEIDVTDAQLTGSGGLHFVRAMADRLDLPSLLEAAMHVKQRRRGCSDAETLLGMIYSLAAGNGSLRDLESFRQDAPTLTIAGLERAPASRRAGEYLSRCTEADLLALLAVVRRASAPLFADVCAREVADRGYVPVFIDGSEIEVTGRYYEQAQRGYSGRPQYWLHGVFVGGLWASQRLCAGGGDVTADWKEQLETDVRPILSQLCMPCGDGGRQEGPTPAQDQPLPVWVSTDNAYYRKECTEYFRAQGWGYSISVTSGTYKRPVLRQAQRRPEEAWRKITRTEEALLVEHCPDTWRTPHSYVVIRTEWDGSQRLLFPRYTVICVSRGDLPLEELVRRHRHKMGMENEFKGPLDALDLHHPPCLRFIANQVFYACGQLAHLLLRAVQYRLLPAAEHRRTIRTLIHDLVRTVARIVRTGRAVRLLFARTTWRLDWIHHAACRLE
jgi:hypothetical protein